MIEITEKDLTILDLIEIAKNKREITLSENAELQIRSSHAKNAATRT